MISRKAPITVVLDPASGPVISWKPPGDKSIAQRAAFAAALADGTSTIRNIPQSDDIDANLSILRQLGVDVWEASDASIVVGGQGLRGLVLETKSKLDVRNSATTARILIGLLAGTLGEFEVDGNELLRKRPMEWIVDPLRKAGARIVYGGESGRLPVRVTGGPLGPIDYQTTVFSAQPVSALIFAGLQGTGPTTIHRRTTARDHTERLLRHLGVEIKETDQTLSLQPPLRLPAFDLNLPGDISTAALPIACVVASPFKRRLVIEDVGINGTRTGFVRTLQRMGAGIEVHQTGMEVGEPVGKIVVESGHRLRGIEVSGDALVQSMIDELPLLAALAARAEGPTIVRDARELKDKDTDRIATTVAALAPFGVKIEPCDDGFLVEPSELAGVALLELPRDHRVIFAAMALASSLPEPTTMIGWENCSVSFAGCLELVGQLAAVSHFKDL
jgi:3-phosphoshikimate 1-carboxyvinyltransferase